MSRLEERFLNAVKDIAETLVQIQYTLDSALKMMAASRVESKAPDTSNTESIFDHRPIGQIILEQERENDQSAQ